MTIVNQPAAEDGRPVALNTVRESRVSKENGEMCKLPEAEPDMHLRQVGTAFCGIGYPAADLDQGVNRFNA